MSAKFKRPAARNPDKPVVTKICAVRVVSDGQAEVLRDGIDAHRDGALRGDLLDGFETGLRYYAALH
jgi:hypothetical protein